LEQAHRELEIRVRQRTSELADTNDRLQTEVVERKKAEEGLRESEARHRAITEAAEDAIITADCAGRIRFWNAAAERIFGYVAAEVVGRNMMDFIVPSRYGEAKHKELMEFARTGDGSAVGHRLELSALRKSGSEFPIELSLSRYRDDTGYVAVALVRDISDRKQTQATLERMHSELVEASHQAGMAEVATGVLHNVGNVLNSANVSTELAIQGVRKISVSGLAKVVALIDEHKDDLGRFVTADDKGRHVPTYLAELCRHLAFEQTGVLNELASLASSIDHIKHIVSMQQRYAGGFGAAEPVALADVLDDAIKMKAAACARHHIHVIREYEDIPDMVLEKHLLLQIVVNLLSNAMGALRDCDQADKTVSVRFHREGERGVRVDVRDNGMGISKEDLTSVFQYGFTTKKDGHGFGLHNSALAAQAMGGSLTAHSDGPGQGATFALVLPLKTLEAKQCKTVGST
jgi:PAS domain S-box-containing protein